MDIREAAERVLKEARKPLHVREIARIALEKGLWQTRGKTPHATVGARLYTDINRRKEESPFISDLWASRPLEAPPVAYFSFTDAAERVLEQQNEKQL